jgi:hypothetical protein
MRTSSCFFNSTSELGPFLTRALAFVVFERSLRPRVGLFAPLRDNVTSSAQPLVPFPVGPTKDRACQNRTMNRRFMCGWPPPGKRSFGVQRRGRLQSCVRPVGAVRVDCWP